MAAPAADAAPVHVGGAALVAGAIWLMTPAGQRATQILGEAMVEGGSQAVDNIRNPFADETETQASAVPTPQDGTRTEERRCDGPHRGRFQAQGYRASQESRRVETSEAWSEPCHEPLRPVGLVKVSALLIKTQAISFQGTGLRGPCFSRMSQHVRSSPASGFGAVYTIGWGINEAGQVRRNTAAGRDAPRIDLEVTAGRAFGDV